MLFYYLAPLQNDSIVMSQHKQFNFRDKREKCNQPDCTFLPGQCRPDYFFLTVDVDQTVVFYLVYVDHCIFHPPNLISSTVDAVKAGQRCWRSWRWFLLHLSSCITKTLYVRIWIKMLMQPGNKKPNKERQPHHSIIAIPMFIMFIPSGLTVMSPSVGKKRVLE